ADRSLHRRRRHADARWLGPDAERGRRGVRRPLERELAQRMAARTSRAARARTSADPASRLRAIARAQIAGVPPLPAPRALRALERLRATFGPGIAGQRWTLLWQVQAGELRPARELARFHEVLAFAAAYPDDPVIEAAARLFLLAFDRRFATSLRRHAK